MSDRNEMPQGFHLLASDSIIVSPLTHVLKVALIAGTLPWA